jgi:very-short-patch-repair endonuclease
LRTESIEQLAARQYGLVTRTQALDSGLTVAQVRKRIETGRWRRAYRSVFVVAGAPATPHQRLLAAVLACGEGAVASHWSAAWLWGLADELHLCVTVPKNRGPRPPGVTVSRRDLERPVIRKGIPVTSPLRTVVDLDDPIFVEQAIDRGVAIRLFTVAAVEAELERLAGSRRPGVGALRWALERRLAHESRPASVLESRMARLLRAAGLPPAATEYPVCDGQYRVDFAWPEVRLAVEVDGYRHHSSWDAFRGDRSRQNDLTAAGWTVLRFTWDDMCHRPGEVAAQIASVLFSLRAG